MRNVRQGFTIVELLIVIVVIGILAAIVIVAYNGVQERARASSASSALSQAAKKIAVWQVDYPSTSPTCTQFGTELGSTDFDCSLTIGSVAYQYTAGTNGAYCITATNGTTSYYLNTTTATKPTAGGCAGHGVGGVAAITNLVANPSLGSNTTGWSGVVSAGGAFTATRETAVTGLGAIGVTTAHRITLSAAPATWWRNSYGSINVTAGQSYTFSSYLRTSVAVPTLVDIIWRNSSNGTISESTSASVAQSANVWERKSVTATAPVGAVSVVLHLGATSGGVVGAYLDSTAMMFEDGSTLHNYADGNSSNWAWNGTVNNSTSTGPPL